MTDDDVLVALKARWARALGLEDETMSIVALEKATRERVRGLPPLRVGERVELEPFTFGVVVGGEVVARSNTITVTVRGYGRIWDGELRQVPLAGELSELSELVAEGLEVVRWTPESGKPQPGLAVWTGSRKDGGS